MHGPRIECLVEYGFEFCLAHLHASADRLVILLSSLGDAHAAHTRRDLVLCNVSELAYVVADFIAVLEIACINHAAILRLDMRQSDRIQIRAADVKRFRCLIVGERARLWRRAQCEQRRFLW